MAGTDHFKAALIIAAGEAARSAVAGVETLHTHNGALGHGATHAASAHDDTEGLASVDANLDADLANWLAALDLRYAAGAHAGPLIDNVNLRLAGSDLVGAVVQKVVEVLEAEHGRTARGLANGLPMGAAAGAVVGAIAGPLTAELNLFLADIDARYVAGVCGSPAGNVMENPLLACKQVAHIAAEQAVLTLERSCRGHWAPGHTTPHVMDVAQSVEDTCDVIAGELSALLVLWDARYAAHA